MDIKSFCNRMTILYGNRNPYIYTTELATNSKCPSSLFKLSIRVSEDDKEKMFLTNLKNMLLGKEYNNMELLYAVIEYTTSTFDLSKADMLKVIKKIKYLHRKAIASELHFTKEDFLALKVILMCMKSQSMICSIINHITEVYPISYFNMWSIYIHLEPSMDADWSLYKLVADQNEFADFPLDDFLSYGQVKSKVWLVDTVRLNQLSIGNTVVHASWAGLTPYLFFINQLNYNNFTCVDIDETLEPIANKLNKLLIKNGKFNFVATDSITYEYQPDVNTVINTSCEHISDFGTWYNNIPDGTLVILQSNDFDDEEHEGGHFTVKNLEEFKKLVPLSEEIYSGELDLRKYRRFMIIGKK